MKLQSDFALLDVKHGRVALAKAMKAKKRVPVTIRGWIVDQHGSDDGVSIEFTVDVGKVEVHE